VSGWVAEQVMYWDDGIESNTYVGGVGNTLSSHFQFTGSAKITSDVSAGFVLKIEARTVGLGQGQNQDTDDGAGGNSLGVSQSNWYLKSNTLGKVTVGQLSPASDNTAILVDGSGSLVPANWVLFDNISFFLNRKTAGASVRTGATWGNMSHCQSGAGGVAGDCGGFAVPGNYIRYDSPTFAGFSVSADWGEDDAWDVAARYAGEFSGFKLAAAASYFEQTETTVAGISNSYWQVGAYLQHVATGLFILGNYGQDDTDLVGVKTGEAYYLKAGVRQKWTPLGHTVLFGEYGNRSDMFNTLADTDAATAGNQLGMANVTSSDLTQWGLGVVQEIDAAAMSIWLTYRNFSADATCSAASAVVGTTCGAAGKNEFEDMHVVKFGALISF
ncbi:MAG: porin, partial [Hyphomicrobium sp.]